MRLFRSEKFNLEGRSFTVRVHPPFEHAESYVEIKDMIAYLFEVFVDITSFLVKDLTTFDRIAISIQSNDLKYGVYFPFMRPERYTPELYLDRLVSVLQSNESFNLFSVIIVRVYRITLPSAGGRTARGYLTKGTLSAKRFIKEKRSLISVPDQTRLVKSCIPRCIVLALARLNVEKAQESRQESIIHADLTNAFGAGSTDALVNEPQSIGQKDESVSSSSTSSYLPELQSMIKKWGRNTKNFSIDERLVLGCKHNTQRWISELDDRTEKLCEAAGINPHGPHSLYDIEKIQGVLDSTQVFVFGASWSDHLLFRGQVEQQDKICLYLDEGECSIVSKPHALLCRSYYCFKCQKSYSNAPDHHKCEAICKICYSTPCCERDESGGIYCPDCNRTCLNIKCEQLHKRKGRKGGRSFCEKFKLCPKCDSFFIHLGEGFEHKCGVSFCRDCGSSHEKRNRCYLTIRKPPKRKKIPKFLFLDIEAQMSAKDSAGHDKPKKYHEVILAVSRLVSVDNIEGAEEKIWFNLGDFFDYLLEHNNLTILAHNSRGYDSHFLLDYLLEHHIEPRVVLRGTNVILFESEY